MDFLINKSSVFLSLKNPVIRKTMGKVATIEKAALRAKIDQEIFLKELLKEINK